MTDNDIVKAFEICQKAKNPGDCEYMGCPARTKRGCRFYSRTDEDEDHDMVIPDEMFNAALDLINRQKAEIERLEALSESLGNDVDVKLEYIHKLEERINTAKAEAIKEFAERLKKNAQKFTEYDEGGWGCTVYAVKVEDIDNTVEEMTEETS